MKRTSQVSQTALFSKFAASVRLLLLTALAFATFILGPTLHAAESAVDKNTIIESLKPKPEMKTRSLRNLSVEKVEPPSISLVIEFDFNSAKISPESLRQIEVLAEAMASDDLLDFAFKVEGHTDAKGKPDYNQKLSERRALAVKEALSRKGVVNDRLVALGKGSQEPANSTDPFAPENRRVKVITLND
jgi:outer membrane protein OmpA-like peptidoglycan-associated protein